MKKHIILLALALTLAMATPVMAIEVPAKTASSPAPAKLSEAEKGDISRIEAYLNDLKSVGANFLQINESGAVRHGAISIKRPGKMRVVYDEPDKDFIVADGSFVNIWDNEMGQQTSIPVGSSIAEFILRENVKLSGDVVITRIVHFPAKLEISLVSAKEPQEGELTLIFEDNPLKLRQWRVLDAQGHTTGVNLENAREGIEFPENTFVFVSPKLGQSGNSKRKN